MAVPRQARAPAGGRVNQKLRTRAAIVDAAQQLVSEGVTPTVAQAAEAALMSRTTAYRYFPTQESLLVELSVTIDVPEIEALVAKPVADGAADEKVLAVLDIFNRHVLADEVLYRKAMRVYLDMWLAAHDEGDDDRTVRAGRRTHWIAESLAPLRTTLPEASFRRLVAALCLVGGTEAMVVMRDVCHLEPDEAFAVTRWAARALIETAVDEIAAG